MLISVLLCVLFDGHTEIETVQKILSEPKKGTRFYVDYGTLTSPSLYLWILILMHEQVKEKGT